MNVKGLFIWLIIITLCIGGGYLLYQNYFTPQEAQWFGTEKPTYRNISQIILSTGKIEAEDTLKIGSIVPGIIKKMYVEENQVVKKGDLLATIDDGKDDTDVRDTAGNLYQAQATLEFWEKHFERQKALYEAKQLSADTFERTMRDFHVAKGSVKVRQAQHDQAKLIFENKRILAPEDGIVIEKVSTEGETVTLASPATIIYTIAKDISRMKVELEVDENRIGEVKVDQVASLTFDTYPYKKFSGTIKDVSNAPIKKNAAVSYNASFTLDNSELLLRPGMTVNARIIVAEKDDVLALPGHVLAINPYLLKQIAKLLKFEFKPMEKTKKHALEKKGTFKTVWIKKGNAFVEQAVELGINDNAYFEVVSGLSGNEDIVNDIIEPDTMQKLYSQVFGKGL